MDDRRLAIGDGAAVVRKAMAGGYASANDAGNVHRRA